MEIIDMPWPLGNKLQQTHGMTGTRTWLAWIEMKRRCSPKNKDKEKFLAWAGRGIKICDQWLHSFEQFLQDAGVCPDGMELDRIDVNGHYQPGNVQWVSELRQQNNRRNNVFLEFNGVRKTISEWARENGVRPHTATQRIKAGWPPELAITRESNKGRKRCA